MQHYEAEDRRLVDGARRGSAKLLKLLNKHHPVEIKKEPGPLLCENCREAIGKIDGIIRVQDVKRAVAKYFELHPADLSSRRKTGKLSLARQITMYLARTRTLKSYPEIGRLLGGRDHGTVIHGVNKIAGLVKSDWVVAYDVAHVEAMI